MQPSQSIPLMAKVTTEAFGSGRHEAAATANVINSSRLVMGVICVLSAPIVEPLTAVVKGNARRVLRGL
jgi:hypothetical protein